MAHSDQISQQALDAFKEGQARLAMDPPDLLGAEEKFRNAIELAPNFGHAVHALGGVLEQQNRLEEACIVERRAIQLLPNDPRPLIALGWDLRLSDKYEEALPYLEKGVELKPHYGEPDAICMLAEVYEHLGETGKAAALWRKVITMDSSYPSYDRPMQEARKKLAEYGLAAS